MKDFYDVKLPKLMLFRCSAPTSHTASAPPASHWAPAITAYSRIGDSNITKIEILLLASENGWESRYFLGHGPVNRTSYLWTGPLTSVLQFHGPDRTKLPPQTRPDRTSLNAVQVCKSLLREDFLDCSVWAKTIYIELARGDFSTIQDENKNKNKNMAAVVNSNLLLGLCTRIQLPQQRVFWHFSNKRSSQAVEFCHVLVTWAVRKCLSHQFTWKLLGRKSVDRK
ncbi:hypothetical protein LguiB_003757 [Lonicera macranthoides]